MRYVPVTDYTASVVSFQRGDLQLVFFGGLTGVQARSTVPGAIPIAQRDIDDPKKGWSFEFRVKPLSDSAIAKALGQLLGIFTK